MGRANDMADVTAKDVSARDEGEFLNAARIRQGSRA